MDKKDKTFKYIYHKLLSCPIKIGEFIYCIILSCQKIRRGSRISRIARLSLEHTNIGRVIGRNIAVLVLLAGIFTPNLTFAQDKPEVNILKIDEQPGKTQTLVQYPVKPVVINQGYYAYHLGLDLNGKAGDPVRPIMKGRVVKTEYSRFFYGKSITIDHKNGYRSLYAHLSKINVKSGDLVTTQTVIGEIGSTGRSTGPHLHLEVYKNGKNINPRLVLGRR